VDSNIKAFWIVFAIIVALTVADRLQRKRGTRNPIIRVLTTLIGLVLLALFLYGMYFMMTVGFPE
jgi:hypothetical protein